VILSLLPLAFTRADIDGASGRTTPWLTIMIRTRPTDSPAATYAHERYHVSYRLRHPLRAFTAAGKRENEEVAHCIGALLRERYYGLPFSGDYSGCSASANEIVASGDFKRAWPELAAMADWGEAAAKLALRIVARRAEAEAWIARHEGLIERVARKLGAG